MKENSVYNSNINNFINLLTFKNQATEEKYKKVTKIFERVKI